MFLVGALMPESKVLNAAWKAVQNDTHDQCKSMINVYNSVGGHLNGVPLSLEQLKKTEVFKINPDTNPDEVPYKNQKGYLYGIKHQAFFRWGSTRIAVLIPESVFDGNFLNYDEMWQDYHILIDVMAPIVLPAAKNGIKCVFVASGVVEKKK
jgi:hypothetical protein